MPFWKWSRDAATNSTADSTCPWPEGMAPSQVNDSARGNMAALAQYRDDIAGITATAGTSTAYTFASFQGFDTLAHMNGAMIVFVPHTGNGAPATLNVDGLGAVPLHSAPGVELVSGMLSTGTPYAATYYSASNQWILHGLFGNPYNIPIGAGVDYWGTTAPNSSFVFPVGQAISRTVYASLFALFGTTFGAGDGSTTYNVPDMRGRVGAAADNMGGVSANRLSLIYSNAGGAETHAVTQANLPAVGIALSGTTSGYTPTVSGIPAIGVPSGATISGFTPAASSSALYPTISYGPLAGFGSLSVSGGTAALGSGTPLSAIPPMLACNYILRVL